MTTKQALQLLDPDKTMKFDDLVKICPEAAQVSSITLLDLVNGLYREAYAIVKKMAEIGESYSHQRGKFE